MSELLMGTKTPISPATGNTEPTALSTFLVEHPEFGVYGSLLPVVGPGCVQMTSDEEIPFDAIHGRILEAGATSDELRFLNALWEERGIARGRSAKGTASPAEADTALTSLRLELLRCALLATTYFAEGVVAYGTPVDDWQVHEIPLDQDDRHRTLGYKLEETAKLAASSFSGDPEWPVELLGAEAIAARLRKVAATVKTNRSISGSLIEWLADLTWHSFIFTGGVDPTTEELAVQLSLICGGDTPTSRVEPSHAVGAMGAFGSRTLAEQLRRVMEASAARPFSPDRNSTLTELTPKSRLYRGLATYLWASYRAWASARQRTGSLPQWPVPMIFSTTYDLELEQALNDWGTDLDRRFHIVTPVYVFANQEDERTGQALIKWLAATVERCPGEEVLRDLDWRLAKELSPSKGISSDEGLAGLQLDGPVVIKLNGSPMHDKFPSSLRDHSRLVAPQRKTRGASWGTSSPSASSEATKEGYFPRLQHAVVFSEFEHLQHLQPPGDVEPALPRWLADAVRQPDRTWAFLGQRLVDWNTRMRLFFDLYYRASKSRDVGLSAVAINRRFDASRSSLLRWLGIERVSGDLVDFVPQLERLTADCDRRYQEGTVE